MRARRLRLRTVANRQGPISIRLQSQNFFEKHLQKSQRALFLQTPRHEKEGPVRRRFVCITAVQLTSPSGNKKLTRSVYDEHTLSLARCAE